MALVAVVDDDAVCDRADHAQISAVFRLLALVLDLRGGSCAPVVRDRQGDHPGPSRRSARLRGEAASTPRTCGLRRGDMTEQDRAELA